MAGPGNTCARGDNAARRRAPGGTAEGGPRCVPKLPPKARHLYCPKVIKISAGTPRCVVHQRRQKAAARRGPAAGRWRVLERVQGCSRACKQGITRRARGSGTGRKRGVTAERPAAAGRRRPPPRRAIEPRRVPRGAFAGGARVYLAPCASAGDPALTQRASWCVAAGGPCTGVRRRRSPALGRVTAGGAPGEAVSWGCWAPAPARRRAWILGAGRDWGRSYAAARLRPHACHSLTADELEASAKRAGHACIAAARAPRLPHGGLPACVPGAPRGRACGGCRAPLAGGCRRGCGCRGAWLGVRARRGGHGAGRTGLSGRACRAT